VEENDSHQVVGAEESGEAGFEVILPYKILVVPAVPYLESGKVTFEFCEMQIGGRMWTRTTLLLFSAIVGVWFVGDGDTDTVG